MNEPWRPLSVHEGSRRKRLGWWLKGVRERIALRLAPWLLTDQLRGCREGDVVAAGDRGPDRGEGKWELLVHGSCEQCGWRAALPEGGHWPLCPGCGRQVLPPPTKHGEEPARMGYKAKFMREEEAIKEIMERAREDEARRISASELEALD